MKCDECNKELKQGYKICPDCRYKDKYKCKVCGESKPITCFGIDKQGYKKGAICSNCYYYKAKKK